MVMPRLLTRRWTRRCLDDPDYTGRLGERLARQFLKRHGYRILGYNINTNRGELDIVALSPDRTTLVITEVKTARQPDCLPELRVDYRKQKRLKALGVQTARRCRCTDKPLRFDVIGVNLPDNGRISIRHHIDAIRT